MKNYILVILLFCAGEAFSQKVCIANLRENIIYIGIPNPLHIVATNASCKSLVVTTNNGKIAQGYELCNFSISPDSPRKAEVTVSKKTIIGLKKIGIAEFRVRHIPDPTPKVAGKSEGTIPKNHLSVQRGVVATLEGFGFDARFVVTKYTLTILRDTAAIYHTTTHNALFSEETTTSFKTLKPADVVLFYGIHSKGPDGRERHLRPIELTIE